MENKYLYIDDDNHENAVEKIDGFLSENLKIDTVQHSNSWEEQLKYIQNHSDDIDGLILDLKLDDCLNENKKRATFRGSTLAQEIRSRQKENLIKQMPIILFSANDKVKSSLEKAGIDIFDLFTKVSHPLKHQLFSFSFVCLPPYPLTVNTCLTEVMQTIHILRPIFPTLQPLQGFCSSLCRFR